MTWDAEQLADLAAVEDARVGTFLVDGSERLTTVWPVVVDGIPYIRSWRGRGSAWFQRVLADPRGSISVLGGRAPVRFEEVGDGAIQSAIDAAYRAKYSSFDYVDDMSEPAALSATLRLRTRVE